MKSIFDNIKKHMRKLKHSWNMNLPTECYRRDILVVNDEIWRRIHRRLPISKYRLIKIMWKLLRNPKIKLIGGKK